MAKEEGDHFSFFVFNFFAALENATDFEIYHQVSYGYGLVSDRNVFEID